MSSTVTGLPTHPRRCATDFLTPNTTGERMMLCWSLTCFLVSPMLTQNELAGQTASAPSVPFCSPSIMSTDP